MFIITIYDLRTGREIATKAEDDFRRALNTYENAVYTYRDSDFHEDDDFAIYDVLMCTHSGDILYGFGED